MVPCGVCRACRINDTTDWSIRALFELHDWKDASFVTFTYDDEHYPKNGSLDKEFMKDYWDRFQKRIAYNKHSNIKYFQAGEYGDHTHRAHYHAIIYGLNPNPFDKHNEDREIIAESWQYCQKEMWNWNRFDYNKNAINFVTRETIQYVAGYVQKKLKSFRAAEYDELGIEAPFKLQSRGLGLNYALENADMLRENGFTYYNGHRVRIPRYFREKLGITKTFEEQEEEEDLLKVKNYLHSKEVHDHFNTLNMKYHAWLDSKGLDPSYIDKPENSALNERLFNWWYEMRLQSLSELAEREFMRVRAMHKGAI